MSLGGGGVGDSVVFTSTALIPASREVDTDWLIWVRSSVVQDFPITDRLADWQTDRLADWQTDRLADWQTDRLADWQTDRRADELLSPVVPCVFINWVAVC